MLHDFNMLIHLWALAHGGWLATRDSWIIPAEHLDEFIMTFDFMLHVE